MRKSAVAVLLLLGLAACGQKAEEQTGSKTTEEGSESLFSQMFEGVSLDGDPVTVAGITFTPPAVWTSNGPSGMRQADYSFGPIEGDNDAASMTVFYFGPESGGTVEANIDRWVGQMKGATGTVRNEVTVHGMTVYTVESMGAYTGSMGGPMGGNQEASAGYRLVGAVVAGPQGNVFFKLTGPDKSAASMTEGFVTMIQGISKAE